MSEYELASLHTQMLGLIFSAIVAQFGVLSAFMVASFLAAHRLSRTMAIIAILLFVTYFVGSIIPILATTVSFLSLSDYMRAYAASGRGLSWHLTARPVSLELRNISFGFTLVSLFLAHLAAIIFFFHCRHVNGKLAKASETLPENRSPA